MEEENPLCLWKPTTAFKQDSNLSEFIRWLEREKGLNFNDYRELWQWSTSDQDSFWETIMEYFHVEHSGKYDTVTKGEMPYTRWFEGVKLNYAEHVFRNSSSEHPAIIYKTENSAIGELSWQDLEAQVASFQTYLVDAGITEGDRVASYLPNIPEAIIAFLAVCGLGAIWSSTSPDFGTSSVIDRIAQIEPKLFIAVDQYNYGGKSFDKSETVLEILKAIPSIQNLVVVNSDNSGKYKDFATTQDWASTSKNTKAELILNRIEFNAPIWVLYSSGTTGLPKAITHSQGGVLLEHLKYLSLHNNIKAGDRCFWFTTTGWMMWNYIQASLLVKGTVVLYDGSPAYPSINALWEYAQDVKINHFGISAGYVIANMKAGSTPGNDYDLSKLISIGSTGSPLPAEGFDWIYREIKADIWLCSISGGSDVCSAFVGGNPLLPVYSGEIQCRALGCALESFDDAGNKVMAKMGEMVITKPMPSMPIYFWNDADFIKYKESYFSMFKGIWRHGDWTEITPRDGVIIYGRSDSTLNRGGVRIGTAEIYRAVDSISEVQDSLVVYLDAHGEDFMPLFVKLTAGVRLNEELSSKLKSTIRSKFTPRHVPDRIIQVEDIPYTISGKKMETPVKKILQGAEPEKVINRDAMRNPESMDQFLDLVRHGLHRE